jgi:phosphinothricin acetyltransferase
MRIRLAEVADAEAILAIYNVEVLESTNTFDMVPRSRAEQEAWILEHSGVHPALVATEAPGPGVAGPAGANGELVLGFGSLSAFRERSGYSATAED